MTALHCILCCIVSSLGSEPSLSACLWHFLVYTLILMAARLHSVDVMMEIPVRGLGTSVESLVGLVGKVPSVGGWGVV